MVDIIIKQIFMWLEYLLGLIMLFNKKIRKKIKTYELNKKYKKYLRIQIITIQITIISYF